MSTVKGTEEVERKIREITPKLLGEIQKVFATESRLMSSHIQTRHMKGGTSADRLRKRGGTLSGSVHAMPIRTEGTAVTGGTAIGTRYARTHVGPRGQETVIKPKKGKFLAVPLPAALTPTGESRGGPKSGVWGETFFWRSKKTGKLLLVGKGVIQKGAKAGQTRDEFLPLFLMLKSVKVPARVHPEDILKWEEPKLLGAMKKIGVKFAQ